MIDTKQSEGNLTLDQIPNALRTCSIRRALPIPVGSFVITVLGVPVSLLAFLVVDFEYVVQIILDIGKLNHSKMAHYTKTSTSCCKLVNWYLGWYLLFNLVLLLVTPLLLALYPIVAIVHATYMMARRTYKESNMYSQASTDGFLDRSGLADSAKEKLAERMAGCFLGKPVLWIGDWLLLTGMVEGAKRWKGVYSLHRTALGAVRAALDFVDWAEDKFHLLPLKKILGDAHKAGMEHVKNEKEELNKKEAQENVSSHAQKLGRLIAFLSMLAGILFWVVVLCVVL